MTTSFDDEPASRKMARWWVQQRRMMIAEHSIVCFKCKYRNTCREGKKITMNIKYGIMGVQR